MLDKNRHVGVGDLVYLAKTGLPYGLKIGTVRAVDGLAGTAFNEADVVPPYSLGDLIDVFIIAE